MGMLLCRNVFAAGRTAHVTSRVRAAAVAAGRGCTDALAVLSSAKQRLQQHSQSHCPSAGELEHTLEGHKDAILELAYSPDGTKLLTASAELYILVWDPHSGQQLAQSATHGDAVADIAWRDNEYFASSSYDNQVHILRLQQRQQQQQATGAEDAMDVDAIAWHSKPLWAVHKVRTLEGHEDDVLRVAWAPNSWLLASCASDKAKLWSMHQVRCDCALL